MVYKILSLNGGGVRGLFQTSFLKQVKKRPGIGEFWKNPRVMTASRPPNCSTRAA